MILMLTNFIAFGVLLITVLRDLYLMLIKKVKINKILVALKTVFVLAIIVGIFALPKYIVLYLILALLGLSLYQEANLFINKDIKPNYLLFIIQIVTIVVVVFGLIDLYILH